MKVVKGLLLITVMLVAANSFGQEKDKAKVEKKFGWIDKDKNESIDLGEMKAFYEGKTNKKGNPVDAESMFYGLDSNNDNKITLEEFGQPIDWKLAKEKKKNNSN